jgi:gluconolactonase
MLQLIHWLLLVLAAPSEGLERVIAPEARAEKIAGGFTATDGLAYSRLAFLLFSDPASDTILKYTPTVQFVSGKSIGKITQTTPVTIFRKPSGGVRGLTFDRQGRLLACESTARRVTRTEKDGRIEVLAQNYQGKPLSGPRDIVHAIDGSTYFTAPEADGTGPAAPPGVYQVTRDGAVRLVASDVPRAAGVTLSPDHRIVYCADSLGVIRAFDVLPDGGLAPGRRLATVRAQEGLPAGGIKTDSEGRIYCAGPGGIWVFNPQGVHLGTLPVPDSVANLGWGDDYTVLYVAAGSSLYRIPLKVAGTRTF